MRVADVLDRTPATDENGRPSGGDSVEEEESGGQEEEKTVLPQRHRHRFFTRIGFSGRAVKRRRWWAGFIDVNRSELPMDFLKITKRKSRNKSNLTMTVISITQENIKINLNFHFFQYIRLY